MKKYTILFIAALLFSLNTAKGQVNLGVSLDSSSASIVGDTFSLGTSLTFDIWVTNSGTANFNDTTGGAIPTDSLVIYTAVHDTGAFFSVLHIIDTHYDGMPFIGAGDSELVTLSVPFNESPAECHRDINVIVIWPYASSVANDTMEFSVFLVDPNGIGELDLEDLIRVYPNPVATELQLNNQSGSIIEEVRISDASGRLMTRNLNSSRLDTEKWSPGMYFLQVRLKNKRVLNIKVLKK